MNAELEKINQILLSNGEDQTLGMELLGIYMREHPMNTILGPGQIRKRFQLVFKAMYFNEWRIGEAKMTLHQRWNDGTYEFIHEEGGLCMFNRDDLIHCYQINS